MYRKSELYGFCLNKPLPLNNLGEKKLLREWLEMDVPTEPPWQEGMAAADSLMIVGDSRPV